MRSFDPWQEAPAWALELRDLLGLVLEKVVAGTAQVSGTLRKMEIEMAANWDAVAAEVERDKNLDTALVTYLDFLVAQVEELKNGADAATQAKIDELATKMKTQNDEMATKIPANTPADPAAP